MLRASDIERRSARRQKLILWVAMIAGTICAGTAFCYKIAEFIFTMSSDDVQGFADVPVTAYFAVAGGWLCLLVWCYATGKFKDVESAKFDMLRQEEEYERLGE
ncbi:MAG: hypothetical protein IT372_16310 [Polyangiaceae bacterium]|nr:hypothetical protein [Polyangiaceae bacterium]